MRSTVYHILSPLTQGPEGPEGPGGPLIPNVPRVPRVPTEAQKLLAIYHTNAAMFNFKSLVEFNLGFKSFFVNHFYFKIPGKFLVGF